MLWDCLSFELSFEAIIALIPFLCGLRTNLFWTFDGFDRSIEESSLLIDNKRFV